MTDLTPHSIQCPEGIVNTNCVGMCELAGKIWIAYSTGDIFYLAYNPDSTGAPYSFPDNFQTYKPNPGCTIQAMTSILTPRLLFISCIGAKNEPDKLLIFNEKTIPNKPEVLVPKCNMFSLSYEDNYPNLVVAVQKKFSIYKIKDDVKEPKSPLDYFNLVATKEAGGNIETIAINKNAVAIYSNGKYRTYWIETGSFVEVSSAYVPKPFALPISPVNFLIGNTGTMIITGEVGKKPSSSIPYNKGYAKYVPAERPRSLLYYKEKVFQFHNAMTLVAPDMSYNKPHVPFKSIPISKVRLFCKRYELDDLLIMTDDEMYTIGGVSPGVRLADKALKSGIAIPSVAIQKIKKIQDQNDVIVDMFRDLWVRVPKDKTQKTETGKILAIQLLSNVLWRMDIREVLSLFPFIMLSIPLENRVILTGLQPIENPSKELLQELGKFLLFTSENYKVSDDNSLISQLSTVDTAIFQFYAAFHQTRELDAFMRDQNSIDIQLVSQYFAQNLKPMHLYPALAIFYTRTEKQVKALSYWETLSNADKSDRWALEASYTLQEISQKNILDENLAWIKKKNVSHAVNALLHPNVDTQYATEWIKKNCPTYMIKFYDYMVQQTNPPPKTPLVEEALMAFCKLLKDLEKPDFNVRVVTYNMNAVAAKPGPHPEMLDQLGQECEEKISNIIRTYVAKQQIDLHPYVKIVKETKHLKLLFEFYQIGEMYKEAIKLIFSMTPVNYTDLQEFCRNSPNCEKAFSVAFNRMIKNKFDLAYIDFLIRNLQWVNYEEMLDWIPENASLAQVENLLKTADNYLIQKQRMMLQKVNIAKSMKMDADYKLTKAQIRNVEIQHTTVCQNCQRPVGDGWVAVAPDSRVYHITCKPKLANNKGNNH